MSFFAIKLSVRQYSSLFETVLNLFDLAIVMVQATIIFIQRKVWQALNLAILFTERICDLNLVTTDTDYVRILQYNNIWQL